MAFKTFNRALYAKIESAEGSLNAPDDDTTDYIETTDPTFTVTNRMFDRNPTRMSISPVPAVVPGTAVSTPPLRWSSASLLRWLEAAASPPNLAGVAFLKPVAWRSASLTASP